MAADLQEPVDLMLEFQRLLAAGEADVVFGVRKRRGDPFWSRWLSEIFWRLYRRFVVSDMPQGGVDVFGCTRQVRDRLLELKESHTNLVALVLWVGFRRAFVPYERQPRLEGRSQWTSAASFATPSTASSASLTCRFVRSSFLEWRERRSQSSRLSRSS